MLRNSRTTPSQNSVSVRLSPKDRICTEYTGYRYKSKFLALSCYLEAIIYGFTQAYTRTTAVLADELDARTGQAGPWSWPSRCQLPSTVTPVAAAAVRGSSSSVASGGIPSPGKLKVGGLIDGEVQVICEVQCIRPSEEVCLLVGGAVQQSEVSERSTAAKLPRGSCAQPRSRPRPCFRSHASTNATSMSRRSPSGVYASTAHQRPSISLSALR